MSSMTIVARGTATFDLYPYNPSAAAGWIFVALFGASALVHLFLIVKFRTWFFIPFVLGCIGELFGYYGRAWSHNNVREGTPYLIQMMLILGSAPLLAASVYMTLGRFIRGLDAEHHALMRTKWLTKSYVAIDIISFICQIMGSAAQASGDADGMQKGLHLVLGGLGFQLIAFICFIAMSAVFHARLNREPTEISRRQSVNWRRYIKGLYCVSVCVFVRSLYRFIEIAAGADTVMVTGETCQYIFDAALLFLATVQLALLYPGKLISDIHTERARKLSGDLEDHIPLNHAC